MRGRCEEARSDHSALTSMYPWKRCTQSTTHPLMATETTATAQATTQAAELLSHKFQSHNGECNRTTNKVKKVLERLFEGFPSTTEPGGARDVRYR
eukprot:m.50469 g.50469  ORF g.50469 m.50469 type:complete len:96 (+) comp11164_c0_seq1:2127-2414(+)